MFGLRPMCILLFYLGFKAYWVLGFVPWVSSLVGILPIKSLGVG